MTQASPRPPRLAVWLIELFVPDEQASSVLGDLLEEFSDVATKSSVGNAQRWYWRQTLPTVLHLLGSGFRAAPWFQILQPLCVPVLLPGFALKIVFGVALGKRRDVSIPSYDRDADWLYSRAAEQEKGNVSHACAKPGLQYSCLD